MKNCPICNALINDTAKYCSECGLNLVRYEVKNNLMHCSQCNALIKSKDKFCSNCGFELIKPVINEDFNDLFAVEREKLLAAFEYDEHADGKFTIKKLKDVNALDITVPKGVIGIADEAFANSAILAIALPEGLIKIGDRAFQNCKQLIQINFPQSLMWVGEIGRAHV